MNIPKELKPFPGAEVREIYPHGAVVVINKTFFREASGLFMPKMECLPHTPWHVLDHYYVIGTRKTHYCGTVIGTPYDNWARFVRRGQRSVPRTYGNIPDTISKGITGKLLRPEYRNEEERKKWPVLLLTDWADGGYNEVSMSQKVTRIPAADTIAGDFF